MAGLGRGALGVILSVLALCCVAEAYVPMTQHSLIPPFDKFKEYSGERDLKDWTYGGAVIAKQNFLRLTPDKQSKRGWLFNTVALEEENFAMQMKFRISGSGRHLYGDGLALWVTQQTKRPRFEEGMLLGHTDTFTGFGILFDTFRNVETGHIHKDISLLVSSGDEPAALDKDRPGCESHYRYYEGADSFDVDKESVVRIWVENGEISLEIDKYGQGDFKKCFSEKISDQLPEDWQERLHIGISASTGALADNHDVLELKVANPSRFKHMIEADEEEKDAPIVQIDIHDDIASSEVAEHVNDLATETSELSKALTKLQHRMEHDIESTKLSLEKMMRKLEEKEDNSQDRIDSLEKARNEQIEKHIDSRLSKLESTLHDTIEARLALLETKVGVQVQEVKSGSMGWRWPLFILFVCVAAYMAYTHRSLSKLNQRDKLF